MRLHNLLLPLMMIGVVLADDSGNPSSYDVDPMLQHIPPFARSLPVQILVLGICLTLSVVLILNLLFTLQYHWTISRMNYFLQLGGLISMTVSATLDFYVILSTTKRLSQEWPYMVNYVGVHLPSGSWSSLPTALWFGLIALSTGFIHITHIQFLAMLYPSNLEAKLILSLMGPLALISAVTELIPMHTKTPPASVLVDLSDSIQCVCNTTLSLLYTIAIFVWALVVNRKKAWKIEGGNAAFGTAAAVLAVCSTTLVFLQTSKVGSTFQWVTRLQHTVVGWQNFVVWWWWIGAGMSDVFEDVYKQRDRRNQAKVKSRSQLGGTRRRRTKEVFTELWNQKSSKKQAQAPRRRSVETTRPQPMSRPTSPLTETYPYTLPLHRNDSDLSNKSPVDKTTSYEYETPDKRSMLSRIKSAHRSAVHNQNIKRIVRQSKHPNRGNSLFRDTCGIGDVRQVDPALAQTIERRRELRERDMNRPWGPFAKWRLRDRTVYQ